MRLPLRGNRKYKFENLSEMNTFIKILNGIKEKIRTYPGITLYLLILLLGCTIYLCLRTNSLLHKIPNNSQQVPEVVVNTSNGDTQTKTSIVANKNLFTPVPSFSQKLLPNRIIYWETKSVLPKESPQSKVDTVKRDTTKLPDLSDFYYRDFLGTTIIPHSLSRSNDSVVQFLVNRKNLTITTYNPVANKFSTNEWDLDFDRYKYNWQPSTGLTQENNRYFSIQPYIQARYQPIHSVMNLGTGISFKTRKLDYNIGINLNHDKRLNKNLYLDLEVSVIYYPIKWQK